MLTPEELDQLNKQWGSISPTSAVDTATKGMTNAEYLDQHGGNIANAKTQPSRNIFQSAAGLILDPFARLASEAGQTIGTGVVKGLEHFQTPEKATRMEEYLNTYRNTPQTVPILGTQVPAINKVTPEQIGGQALGAVGVLTGNPMVGGAAIGAGNAMENNGGGIDIALNGIVGAVGGKVLEVGFKAAAPAIDKVIQKYGTPALEKLSAYIPDAVKASYQKMAEKADTVMSTVADKTGINKLGEVASNVNKGVSDKVSQATQSITGKVTSKVVGKTPEEVLSTTVNDFAKLNPEEQKLWIQKNVNEPTQAKLDASSQQGEINKGNIEAQGGLSREQIEQDFSAKNDALDKEAQDLKTAYSQASTKDVETLRPKAQKLLSDKSEEFGKMRDEAISGKEDTSISNENISNKIDELIKDKQLNQTVKERLGVDKSPKGTTTVGKLYQSVKDLRDTISSSATKGNRVFDPDELSASKAVSVLNEVMADKGVDFSKANSFWKKWASLRDDVVTKFKIFDPYDTEAGAKVLRTRAEGASVQHNKFLSDMEKEIGQPLDKETQGALANLKANELAKKQTIIEKANKLAESRNLEKYNKAEETRQVRLRNKEITNAQSKQLEELNKRTMEEYNKAWKSRVIKWVIQGGISFEGIKAIITHHL